MRKDIRIGLPSKGRLATETLELLESAGLRVYKPNPRQYQATIPALPGLTVLFQRPADIVVSVRDGSVDFGLTGWDIVAESQVQDDPVLPLTTQLGYGRCTLHLIVPRSWKTVRDLDSFRKLAETRAEPLRVATKYSNVTGRFFERLGLPGIQLVRAEGTLEVAPTIGYADAITDLVSTGTTLRENGLRALPDGVILESEAALIANRPALKKRPEVLAIAHRLLEFIVAHLRARENAAVFANIRGESPEQIAAALFEQSVIGGLQGPTISPVLNRAPNGWYAVHIIVRKDDLPTAIRELRAIGGSGVVVTPVTYLFEEEPEAYTNLLRAIAQE